MPGKYIGEAMDDGGIINGGMAITMRYNGVAGTYADIYAFNYIKKKEGKPLKKEEIDILKRFAIFMGEYMRRLKLKETE